MDFKRAERVAGLIREEVAEIIQRDVKDPRVAFSTITSVKVTDDLKIAKVYFVCETKRKDRVKKGLENSKGFIKKRLSQNVNLRYLPDIVFYYDDSLDYSFKIEGILRKVKKEDD